jgi:hypothetical protein
MVYLEPLSGQFPKAEIEQHLQSIPFSLRDPINPDVFLLCASADAWESCRKRRMLEPGSGYPYVCLVSVEAERIDVSNQCDESGLEQARSFVEWVVARYPSRVLDDNGNDWTEQCKTSLDVLFARN